MEGENTHKAEELGQGGLLVEKHTHPGLEDFGVDGRGGLLVEKRTHPGLENPGQIGLSYPPAACKAGIQKKT